MNQVEEIKAKTDIVQIIGEHINLKKAGRNFRGVCPFHNEKTPSFMVSPELQIFKCFGCGESGDVFTFLQKHEGLEFYEVLRNLAARAGVELKSAHPEASSKREILKSANFEAARFYNYILLAHKKGEEALRYLTKERGLGIDTIKEFKLGFAPEDRSILTGFLTTKKKFKIEDLFEAGLAYKTPAGYFDRFRERIIFPISDNSGNTIALAGRILPSLAKPDLAKYINSPETPIYHKSRSLFGLGASKSFIKRAKFAILVEGEMDFLSCWQAGIKNVVAVKGTALTEEQVTILSRFTEKIILALDADFAGDTAALRGITLAQNADLEIKVCDMGKHKDPDEFARKDEAGFKNAIKNAQDVWEYIIDTVAKRQDVRTASGKSRAVKIISPLLSSLDNRIARDHYIQKLAQRLGVGADAVSIEIAKYSPKAKPGEKEEAAETEKKSRKDLLEEEVLILGLRHFPQYLTKSEVIQYLDSNFSKRVAKLTEKFLKTNNEFSLKDFSNDLPGELLPRFSVMVIEAGEEPVRPKRDFEKALESLAVLITKEKINEVTKKMPEAKGSVLKNLQSELSFLSKKLKSLEENGFSGIIDEGEW